MEERNDGVSIASRRGATGLTATHAHDSCHLSLVTCHYLIALTRPVSPSINACELTYHHQQPIDVARAAAQHQAYEDCLRSLGVRVIQLAAEPDLPDAVFVEDTAIVVDEIAIIPLMGAASRRP